MGQVTDTPATYADIEALPPNVVGEILFGRLVTHPRPAPRHVHAAASLGGELFGPFHKGKDGPGGWRIYSEPELHLTAHVIVPDIAGWRRVRLPQLPSTAFFQVVPDWVCECLSPSTQRYDKGDKRLIYAELGVSNLWYIDPSSRTLEVFTLDRQKWVLAHTYFDDDTVAAPPFEAVTFALGELWDDAPADLAKTVGN